MGSADPVPDVRRNGKTRRKTKQMSGLSPPYGNFGFHERSPPFALANGSVGRLSACEPRSLRNPTSFVEGSLLYGGGAAAVTNPKHLRRGLRCGQPTRSIPVEPPVAHGMRQSGCGGRGHSLPSNDCCSCSSATGSTGTASLTESFVVK